MFYACSIRFRCVFSESCRNISATVFEMGDPVERPFLGWYVLLRNEKQFFRRVTSSSVIVCLVVCSLLFCKSRVFAILSVSCIGMLTHESLISFCDFRLFSVLLSDWL